MGILKKIIAVLCWILLIVISYLLFKGIVKRFEIFLKGTEYYLTIFFVLFAFFFCFKKYKLSIAFYILMLFIFLTFREKTEVSHNFNIYLGKWLKIIHKNETVFINVFGNIFLFIPLTYLVFMVKRKYFISLVIMFFLVLFFEFLQLITKTGVFDIVDILLNMIGIIGTICLYKLISIEK